MDHLYVILLMTTVGLASASPILKGLSVEEIIPFRRAEACDQLVDTCIAVEEECVESDEICSVPWHKECDDWTSSCTTYEKECVGGVDEVCTAYETTCVGGYEWVCTSYEEICKVWAPWPFNYLCDETAQVCKMQEKTCMGWGEVCTTTEYVCQGTADVCKQYEQVCNHYEKTCEGTLTTVCYAYGDVCTASGEVCDVVYGVVEAIIEAVENFGECIEGFWNEPESMINTDCEDNPLNNIECYASASGESVADGFEAGCTIPSIAIGVEFGSADPEGDRNTSLATIEIGDWALELPILQQNWTEGSLKDFAAVEATTGFDFVNDAKLTVSGTNYDLTVPGVEWNLDSTITLFAEELHDPCEEDIDRCRIVLNEGKTNVFQQAVVVGAIPLVITVTAEVYVGVFPKFEGSGFVSMSLGLDESVTLLHSVDLELDDPEDALEEIQKMVDVQQLALDMASQIRFDLSGELAATASLDFCVGVVLGFFVNGVGIEIDIPVCLTAALEVAADADLSGANLEVAASLSVGSEIPFELDIPDASTVVDTACGMVQAPMEYLSPVTQCAPIVGCFTDLVDDTCEGVSEAVSALDISVQLGSITLFDYEIWSGTVSLSTDGSEDDDHEPEAINPHHAGRTGAAPRHGCTRYDGFNMIAGYEQDHSDWVGIETVDECENLCLADEDCDQYTFFDDNGKTACFTWSLATAREYGRTDPVKTWPRNVPNVVSGRCNYWVELDLGESKMCNGGLLISTHLNSYLSNVPDLESSLETCKHTCETTESCTHIYHSLTECRLYSACYGEPAEATTTDGTVYHFTDSVFDQKAKLTWGRTGCPNPYVDTSRWQKLLGTKTDQEILDDMVNVCAEVGVGDFASEENLKACCGEEYEQGMKYCYVSCRTQHYWAGDGSYQLAFRQTLPYLWTHEQAKNLAYDPEGLNMDDKANDNYAMTGYLQKMKQGADRFFFKLRWPQDPTVYFTWSQSTNPITETHKSGDYAPRHVPYTGRGFQGLEKSHDEWASVMDGSVNTASFYYAVGAFKTVNDKIPAYSISENEDPGCPKYSGDMNVFIEGCDFAYDQVELYAFRGFRRHKEGTRLQEVIELGVADSPTQCSEKVQAELQCSTTVDGYDCHNEYNGHQWVPVCGEQEHDAFHFDLATGACACQRGDGNLSYDSGADSASYVTYVMV